MVMLLRSRGSGGGRRRGKSGLFSTLGHGLVRLLGGSSGRRDPGPKNRGASLVPGWLALAVALACFGGGYVVRGYVAPVQQEIGGGAGLKAGPRAPGVIEADTEPLTSRAFFVAAYQEMAADEARSRAMELSRYLRGQGLAKARPYEYPAAAGRLWVVVVYYDGPTEYKATREQLLALPADVPDPIFVGLRNHESDWPNAFPIR